MSIGPIDYYGELSPIEDEVEWPGTLPDYVEEWNELWFIHTVSPEEWFQFEEDHLGVTAA